ncbi:MAG: archaeosortase H [Promethearchaeota archaeon]
MEKEPEGSPRPASPTSPTSPPTVIEFEGKSYTFTKNGILFFLLGTPLISLVVYFGSSLLFWRFIHLNVAGQTAWFLTLLFREPFGVEYYAFYLKFFIIVPGRAPIGFTHYCSGFQATAIFAGIILSTPHPVDPAGTYEFQYRGVDWAIKKGHANIWVRKLKCLALSATLFHVVNIIRMVIQLGLYYHGYAWEDIHYSISAASSFIAAVIILLMHRWLPEFVFSIIFIGAELKKKAHPGAEGSASVEGGEATGREDGAGKAAGTELTQGQKGGEAATPEVKDTPAPSTSDPPRPPIVKDKAYWTKFWALYYLHAKKEPVEVEDDAFGEFVNDPGTPLMVECGDAGVLKKAPYFLPCFGCGKPVTFEDAVFSLEDGSYCPKCAGKRGSPRENGGDLVRGKRKFTIACVALYALAVAALGGVFAYLLYVATGFTSFEANMEIAVVAGVLSLVGTALALLPRFLTKRLALFLTGLYLERNKREAGNGKKEGKNK